MHYRHAGPALIAALCCLGGPAVVPAAAAAGCPGAHGEPGETPVAVLESATVCLLNAERTRHGLRAVSVNGKLSKSSLDHSVDMVINDLFSHSGSDGSNFVQRIRSTGYLRKVRGWRVAENIAEGTGTGARPSAVVEGWMNSPEHRENILNGKLRDIGIGIEVGVPGQPGFNGATYTTDFGSRRG